MVTPVISEEQRKKLEKIKLEIMASATFTEPGPDWEDFDPKAGWRFIPLNRESYLWCVCDICGSKGHLYATHFTWEHHKEFCPWNSKNRKEKANGTDTEATEGCLLRKWWRAAVSLFRRGR